MDLGDQPLMYYILEGHEVIPVTDVLIWAKWFEKAWPARQVAHTDVTNEIMVSTVFLGLDHSFGFGGPPLLFETMVFGGPMDQEMERYSTWDEAKAGHEEMVQKVRMGMEVDSIGTKKEGDED